MTIESAVIPQTEKTHEKQPPAWRRTRAAKFMAKMGVAAMFVVPTADLALSDAVGIKIYQTVNEKVRLEPKAAERTAEIGINSGIIMVEAMALGLAISRSRKLRGAFAEFDEYQEEKYKTMRPARKAVSKVAHAPFVALGKVGEKMERVGEKIASAKSKTARSIGSMAVDAGMVNIFGNSGVVAQETAAGRPPSVGRNARLAALITVSWMGVAEGIRAAYDHLPVAHIPLQALGQAFETATSVDVANPWRTPVGSAVIGSIACALAYTGWQVGSYHEQKAQAMQPNE